MQSKKIKHQTGILLMALAWLGFISLGLPDGLDGVAWPSIRMYFHLPYDALGQLLIVFTTGYLASSFGGGWLLTRLGLGMLLTLSCLATALCQLAYSVVPTWGLMVAVSFVAGLGAGAIDAGLNVFAATRFSSRMVNWLHACYGIGATIGPLIMTSVIAARPNSPVAWQRGYAIVGVWQMLLAVCFGATRRQWPRAQVSEKTGEETVIHAASGFSTLRLPVVWLSLAIFFLYCGVETAAGVWVYSLFTESRAVSVMTAGAWVSVYWGALTAGRLLSGLLANVLSERLLLRYCTAGLITGAALIWMDAHQLLSFGGLGLMGLAAAPIFPMLIAATPGRLGEAHTINGTGFQIGAAVLGRSVLPGLTGVLARHAGLETVGPILFISSLLLFVLHEIMLANDLRQ